ncbi:MAG: M61 family metallopeptidase [Rhodothermia bacterium]
MIKSVRTLTLAALLGVLSVSPALAQLIRYEVAWDTPNSHYFNVDMTFSNPENGPVSVRIPSWRPGRYIIQDYARNIVRFAVHDGSGNPLAFRKTDKATWEIDASPGQEISVTYQAYSRQLDGGSSYLDETEAYLNPITLLMYIPGRELEPAVLSIAKPDSWKTATALDYRTDADGYWAEDYHELVDSPFLISPTLDVLSFELGGTTFELAIQGEGGYDPDRLVADFRKMVEAQTNLMGVIPFDRYVFLFHFLRRRFGHAVEHKNSTSIVIGPVDFSKPGGYRSVLGISSHEFWHAWLVERIRPEAIYRPDYSKEAYSSMFWIYEGITSYYGGLTLVRAGLSEVDAYEKNLGSTIGRFKDAPGREVTSVAMSSWDAWTKSNGAPPNSFYSFYTAGNVLGLVLDMEVRGRTRNRRSLDDVIRYLYQNYAARDRGVPENGFQKALETITNGTFQPFFDDHVYGTKPIDYDRYLFHAGYALEEGTDPKKPEAQLGIDLSGEQETVRISSVRPGGGAYLAGLDIDDVIIAIDGKKATLKNMTDLLKAYAPGETVEVLVFRRDRLASFKVVLQGGGNKTYTLKRMDDTNPLQNQTRRDWLNLPAG